MQTKRKIRIGRVTSDKMNKTVVVSVEETKHHPLYRKTVKEATRFKAHDEQNACGEGDIVKIIETRPLSKDKRWRVAEIIAKKAIIEVKPEEIT